jgi:hypothetical protein
MVENKSAKDLGIEIDVLQVLTSPLVYQSQLSTLTSKAWWDIFPDDDWYSHRSGCPPAVVFVPLLIVVVVELYKSTVSQMLRMKMVENRPDVSLGGNSRSR